MKEKILKVLEGNVSYTTEELEGILKVIGSEELKTFYKTLNELEEEFLIYRSKKNKFSLFSNTKLKKGILRVNKRGYGFVDIETGDDIYVSRSNMGDAIHEDVVIVEAIKETPEGTEGRIVRVIKRGTDTFVGEFIKKKTHGYILLDEANIKLRIDIPNKDTMGAVSGHKVVVKVTNKKNEDTYNGKVIKILGHKNDPGVDILSIVYKYGINTEFSEEVMRELDNVPESLDGVNIGNRKDLRNIEIITIDGTDAKDLDDAISISKLSNGNYNLGVHIADVSYYVKEGTELDLEAYDRGTSVYLADRVIPMLPHKLSNGICSLNEGVDRFTLTCEMEINGNGEVIKESIYESIIKSKKRCDYKSVNKILEDGIMVDGYESIEDSLKLMYELSLIIRKNREKRGAIDFEQEEPKIIVDEFGKAVGIERRDRGVGEKLIEDFMIAANETVASFIYNMEYPFVYRIHEYPKAESVNEFLGFVSSLGYKIKPKNDYRDPRTVQDIIEVLKDSPMIDIFSSLLLRCMKKAIYSKDNIGHYGLGSKCYTHFTSPIRRYPDTTVHRLLRTYLFEKRLDEETVDYYKERLVPLTEHSSKKERDAQDCEREVDDMKMAEYMTSHIGEEFDGIITSVQNFGMFVTLPNLIEGLIHVTEMDDDYYHYDELGHSFVGEANKKVYRIGNKVRVKVISASKEEKKIDFKIVKTGE